MIFGVGTDIVEVDRIASKINKENGFKELVFSKNEIEYCELKANKMEHFAARFAAKEAFFKALGTGWATGTAFNQIEITNNETGKPEMFFISETAKTISSMQLGKIFVSLSHVKTMATAIVIIETK